MASLVYLTTHAPSKFAEELILAGHQVHEALAVSEALYLCEKGSVDLIVMAPDVEDPDLIEAPTSPHHHPPAAGRNGEGIGPGSYRSVFPQQPGMIQ